MIGLIGRKLGMTQVFDAGGNLMPVTVLEIEPNVVVAERTVERDGYEAVVLGAMDAKASRLPKPVLGQFEKNKISPKKHMVEVRDFEGEYTVGGSLDLNVFDGVEYVDVMGRSKGKGYQGVMRRHNFSGGRKTHGSKFHRANGSTGMAATPSRTIKGTKMAGRMGGERRTVLNLRVVGIDPEKHTMLVQGAVPGTKDGYILVRRSVKKG